MNNNNAKTKQHLGLQVCFTEPAYKNIAFEKTKKEEIFWLV